MRRLRLASKIGAALVATWLLLEAVVWITSAVRGPSLALTAHERERRLGPAAEVGAGAFERHAALADNIANKAVHPYAGYVYDPADESIVNLDTGHRDPECPINELGFVGEPSLLPANDDEVAVIILGGSVALQLFCLGRGGLTEALAPFLAGRRARFLSLAIGGYHQPQQLAAFAYYLSLGGHADLVINIDGYNELISAYVAGRKGRNVSHPMHWEQLVADLDRDAIEGIARIAAVREERLEWARTFDGPPGWSPVGSWIWWAGDQRLAGRLAEAQSTLSLIEGESRDASFATSGPPPEPAAEAAMLALWERCSRLTHTMAEGHGASYLHVLQPNQWLPGEKPHSRDELALFGALLTKSYKPATLTRGYAAMRERGASLLGDGVPFLDASGVFRSHRETLYMDTCCHLNARGNDLLARAIGEAVVASGERAARDADVPAATTGRRPP